MRWLIALALLPGCKSLLGFDELAATDSTVTQDGSPIDTPTDVPPAEFCFGSVDRICLPSAPTGDVDIGLGQTMAVDTGATCAETTSTTLPDACVIAMRSFTTAGSLRATGNKTLVLVVSDIFEVQSSGRVDVASRDGDPGAGTRPCTPATLANGGGGGAGASFVARGGTGGQGDGGSGGTAVAGMTIDSLVGGCSGAPGAGSMPGGGGTGGGGVLIIAGSVFVDGRIDASGQGGGGSGGDSSGGGGGGSGGMIVVDAPSIDVRASAAIIARGGGGGGGGGIPVGTDGAAGEDGESPNGNNAAQGGQGGEPGAGIGGTGGTNNNGNNGGGSGARGGGGGGGSTGIIRLVSPILNSDGTVVPLAT